MKTSLNSISRKFAIAFVAINCLLLTTPLKLNAQSNTPRRSAEERAKAQTEKMKETLTLNDTLYQAVYDINLKYAKKMNEAAKKREIKRSELEKGKSMQEDKEKELKSILTDEQYKKYQDTKDQRKPEAKETRKRQNK
jgi:hypothetical protein